MHTLQDWRGRGGGGACHTPSGDPRWHAKPAGQQMMINVNAAVKRPLIYGLGSGLGSDYPLIGEYTDECQMPNTVSVPKIPPAPRSFWVDEYLTPPQVARVLHVRPDKVLSWIRSGELDAVDVSERRGGRPRWRIWRNDLDIFLERRRAKPATKPSPRSAKPREAVIEFF
jgi:excisionase family DNA binding protein